MKTIELRANTIKELIETEKAYLKNLFILEKYFVEPIASLALLPPEVHNKVFGELSILQAINVELLNMLVSGIERQDVIWCDDGTSNLCHRNILTPSWLCNTRHLPAAHESEFSTADGKNDISVSSLTENVVQFKNMEYLTANCKQKSVNEFENNQYLNVNVGKAFVQMAPFLKSYATYATNYQDSLHLIEEQQRRSPALASFLRSAASRPEVQRSLWSLLIAPVQRVPRYTLLLAELLRHTPPGHPHRQELESSVSLVAGAASRVDACVGEAQQRLQLMALQRALHGQRPRVVAPGRDLLRAGLLHKANRSDGGSAPRLFFLLTDILLYTKLPSRPPMPASPSLTVPPSTASQLYDMSLLPHYRPGCLVCCCVLPLRHCTVIPLFAETDHTPVFRVVCRGEDLTLYSRHSADDGAAWITALRSAVAAAVAGRRTLKKDSSAKMPLRRPALRRGGALMETDTVLRELKVSSPQHRIASPLLLSPSTSSPVPPEDSSPASSSSVSSSSSSLSLLRRLQPSRWRTRGSGALKSRHDNNERVEGGSHVLGSLVSHVLARSKKNATAARPTSAPVEMQEHLTNSYCDVRLQTLPGALAGSGSKFLSIPNCHRLEEHISESGLDGRRINIYNFSASPDSLKYPRVEGPYRSKWNTGEIDITPEKCADNGRAVNLSSIVKPKHINCMPHKRQTSEVRSNDWPPHSIVYPGFPSSRAGVDAPARSNRRRSRSFTLDRINMEAKAPRHGSCSPPRPERQRRSPSRLVPLPGPSTGAAAAGLIEGSFDEAWRRDRLWGRKRAAGLVMGDGNSQAPCAKRKFF